ncbi:MAG: site-2 protease family protein [bacterium]|nr:site-2 protease family protein [bacterium]MDZ4299808.1 site-2 protease family protein [Candidatus Sungbacteria bacterium]
MENAIQIILAIIVLVFSVIIHEVAHGYAALSLGDHTAEHAGRLTLNPVPHIDPFGSILIPGMLAFFGLPVIGWARPVPYNPYNLRNQKWGPTIVGLAGPVANIALAVSFGIIIRIAFAAGFVGEASVPFLSIAALIVGLNLSLAVFNLMPIPPLDGSKVLFALIPYQYRGIQYFLERYGIILIFLLIPIISSVVSPLIRILFRLLVGGAL